MKKARLGDTFYWQNKLAYILGVVDQPSVIIEMYDSKKCPHCDGDLGRETFSVIPTSPLFQENAEPIKTLEEQP